jgi:hypothetical protein
MHHILSVIYYNNKNLNGLKKGYYIVLSPSLHSWITKVQPITIIFFSYFNIFFGPIFLDMVFPFKWLQNEFEINMFHDLP